MPAPLPRQGSRCDFADVAVAARSLAALISRRAAVLAMLDCCLRIRARPTKQSVRAGPAGNVSQAPCAVTASGTISAMHASAVMPARLGELAKHRPTWCQGLAIAGIRMNPELNGWLTVARHENWKGSARIWVRHGARILKSARGAWAWLSRAAGGDCSIEQLRLGRAYPLEEIPRR